MFKISDEEIKDFRNKNKKILKELKSKKEVNLARNWYKFRDSIRQGINYIIMTLCRLLPPTELKNHIYRLMGATIGENVSIANGVILDPIFPELIKIDDNATIGWETKLFTHEFDMRGFRVGTIHIEENSMVGEFSVIRPGVEIGKNSQIAAMSFVNEDVEENTLEGGVPMHLIKHYKEEG